MLVLKHKLINYLKRAISASNTIGKNAVLKSNVSIIGSFIGGQVTIEENTKVIQSDLKEKCLIGPNSFIDTVKIIGDFSANENCKLNHCHLEGNISLGKFTSLWGPNLDIMAVKGNVSIGNFCSIARNVSIQTYNHNHKKATSYFIGQNFFKEKWENEKVSKGDVVIENDVWIGSHCVILGGVTIHNGAVVAANSVVNKDVPPFSIVAGTPAKVIGYRFDESTITKLQDLQWWNWSNEKIQKNKALFENELASDFETLIVS
ncbi:xenobiotic acyltransferase family protein [Flavobacterium sp.]|uniref:xenobiotic acyltransferase family protein n=1 Tax=Flavobacterium sp. TaxID=239 RepID=UPI0040475598